MSLSESVNWNVDLDVETPIFYGDANLTVRSFKAKTATFKNRKELSARDYIHIETGDFTNTSGRLQSHGDVRIKADGLFRNTGGGTLQKNVRQTLSNYIWNGSELVSRPYTFYRDIYHPNLSKSGVITGGGYLDIVVGSFDNAFGILNATQGLRIRSLGELSNECGLIYSGGQMVLRGTLLRNGYMKGSESIVGVNPNAPIKESRVSTYQALVKSGYRKSRGGFNRILGKTKWVDTTHYETKRRTEVIITGYRQRIQSISASQYPGYIFSNGDLDIQMNSDAYLGTIVSGGDVRIKGINQKSINAADRGLLVVRGDVVAELRKAALEQLSMQAQNIYIQLIDDLLIRGVVKPIIMPDGSAAQIIDLQKLGLRMGFLLHEATFTEQDGSVTTPTGFIPMGAPHSFVSGSKSTLGFSLHSTNAAGFMGTAPETPFFMPTVQDHVLNQLITMTLAPIHGRDILLSVDLAGQLRNKIQLEEMVAKKSREECKQAV